MNIGIIGIGYVGLVQGVILSEFGLNVICMDSNENKISQLKKGEIPIYEPGLEELLIKNIKEKRINFTTDIEYTIKNSEVIFIAVGTPSIEDGSADITHVLEVVKQIGMHIDKYKIVVNKSTVPVGSGEKIKNIIKQEIINRQLSIDFDIVSNPEFLREGKAVEDCLRPDRVVIGFDSEKAKEKMKQVYDVLYINETPFVFTNIETAEMIKYASNAFLAVKVSFINELALLSEKVGANVQQIASAMGQDGRISPKFLHAGPGYGGSCFPKDTRALSNIAKKHGELLYIVDAAIKANEKQKIKVVEKIIKNLNGINGKTLTILGLSFKPETDDTREAPALDIIRNLINNGAKIKTFCPQGMTGAKWRLVDLKDSILYCENEYDASKDTEAVIFLTEWNQFRGINLKRLKNVMKNNIIFDFRNIFSKKYNIEKLFKYYLIGKKESELI